jgi:hypothetical protein
LKAQGEGDRVGEVGRGEFVGVGRSSVEMAESYRSNSMIGELD